MPLFSPTAANVAQTARETVALARSCVHSVQETLAAVLGAVIIAVAAACSSRSRVGARPAQPEPFT